MTPLAYAMVACCTCTLMLVLLLPPVPAKAHSEARPAHCLPHNAKCYALVTNWKDDK